jgi:hypothetical protein
MRIYMLASSVVLTALTVTVMASAASAAIEILPGAAKTPFTATGGKDLVQEKGGTASQCTKSEVAKGSAELLSTKTLLFVIDLTGCKALGLSINSLGDVAGTVLVHYEGEFCTVSTKPLVGGLLLKPLPVHIEVPSAGVLLLEEGSVVGGVSPENTSSKEFRIKFEQKEGRQAIEGCLNAEGTKVVPETLTTSQNGKATVATGLEISEFAFTFETAQTFMT